MSTIEKKKRRFEEKLPEGYREALAIDFGSGRLSDQMRTVTMLVNASLLCLIWFGYAKPRWGEIAAHFSVLKCLGFLAAYYLYIVLHELTHGFVYKLMTGKKLSFGFQPPVAYCGVRGIYAYRSTAMLSLMAPLTLFGVLLPAAFFLTDDPFGKALILVLLAFHLSGCYGDLYNIGLYLFRFRDPGVLREDTGPKQIYYTNDGTASSSQTIEKDGG